MKTSLYQVVCACLLLSLFSPQKPAYAQEVNFAEIPLEALHDEKSIELQGLSSIQTLDVWVPQNWTMGEESWVEMRFRGSPSLDAERSSITVTLNDLPLLSTDLASVLKTKQQIFIPANRFIPGKNSLTFTSILYLPSDQETNCQNWDDPARWLALEPGGLLHLSFKRDNPQIDLSDFPQGFIDPMERYLPEQARRQTLIVLPENSTEDDLTSLSTLSYLLGHAAGPDYEWSPEILNAAAWNKNLAVNRNVIFIGDAPIELPYQASQGKDSVGLYPSPWSVGNAVLVIHDQHRQDGFTPAWVFSDPARNILLQGNIAYVDPFFSDAPAQFRKRFSFEDLGYPDRMVRGTGKHSLIYRLYVPYDVEPVVAKLKLDLFHSPNLNAGYSSFTVYLNGFSIAAILPGTREGNGEPITIGLPAKRFRPGLNFIRVSFDLHVSQNSCEHSLESIWGSVLNSSTIETTYRKRTPTPSLQHFPLPFNDPSGSLLVLPDLFQQTDLTHLSQFSFMLGASAYQPTHPPGATTAASFKPEKTNPPNVILMGTPLENSVTNRINDLLPQPFRADGHSLQEGYGVQLPTADKDASLGLLQILPSPWSQGGTVLVLTGTDPQGLEWTWNAVLNSTLRDQFHGNLMVVGSTDQSLVVAEFSSDSMLQTLFQQIADAGNIPVVGPLLQRYGQNFLAPALVAVGIALLLVIGFFWVMELLKSKRMRI